MLLTQIFAAHAQQLLTWFPPQPAQQLLSVAVDSAATPAERQVAYKRVREELDGLIVVSDEAIVVLEKKVALPLDATASDAPAPAAD